MTQSEERVANYPGLRDLGAYLITKIQNAWNTAKNTFVNALSQSAWAANNSVDVGMTETAEVLNAMLAQPGSEQIYTTQPAWDFNEGQSLTLGGTATISDVEYPVPSLVYDSGYVAGAADAEQHIHVVFPIYMWVMDGHYVYEDNTAVAAADEASVQQRNGNYYLGNTQVYPTGKYSFVSSDIIFRHNCNYLGGGLDGFLWQEVSLTSGSSVEVTGDAQTGFTAKVPTTATVKVGTWVRLTYTESDASKTAYGYVSAVGEDEVTVTVVGTCGEAVTKVELYKPLQG